MLDAVSLQPGERVLELAAGLGETGMLAAELVAPMGGVIVSDQADAMLEGARARAVELGLSNIEFQVIGAEWIDLPLASVDAVLCRWGYMLMADPPAALRRDPPRAAPGRARGAGRVGLRPAQPLGAAADPGADRARPRAPPPAARRHDPARSRSATPSACASCSQQAGFAEIDVHALEIVQRHASFDDYWETTLDISHAFHDTVLSRPEPEIAEIRAGPGRAPRAVHRTPTATLAIPGRTLVAPSRLGA